eukprot:TRINITY_DN71365_c0_g1_i1.p1 TRINITY_DN71365_c0_g1~~TRINITY_DN71365_c0_g1_i1.p1  ORF type:complete len:410 (+),score=81.03 TRINITY_DN71365_c0_g1_i1:175-1230(+)
MLPLVNFAHDYFQKVECEASVQLLRLQNSRKLRAADAEEDSSAQLDMVRWVHFMTDAVMQCVGNDASVAGSSPVTLAPTSPPSPSGGRKGLDSVGLSSGLRGLGDSGVGGSLPYGTAESSSFSSRRPSAGTGSTIASTPGASLLPLQTAPSTRTGEFLLGRPSPNTSGGPGGAYLGSAGPGATTSTSSALGHHAGAGAAGRGYLNAVGAPGGLAATAMARGGGASTLARHEDLTALAEPLAEPGIGGSSNEGPDGLVLGAGSWASAYRESSGARRDALRLLCSSGIVTARELADDNTVITAEHIDECVQIAGEMLQTWPMDIWAKEPQEAKAFFEARLTALYQKKFGEQKG